MKHLLTVTLLALASVHANADEKPILIKATPTQEGSRIKALKIEGASAEKMYEGMHPLKQSDYLEGAEPYSVRHSSGRDNHCFHIHARDGVKASYFCNIHLF